MELIRELLNIAEGKVGAVKDLTPAQKKRLIANFKSWSGGFTPDECPMIGRDEPSVASYITHALPTDLPQTSSIKYLKSFHESALHESVSEGQRKLYNAIVRTIGKVRRWEEKHHTPPTRDHLGYSHIASKFGNQLKAATLEGKKEFDKVWHKFQQFDVDIWSLFADILFEELGARPARHDRDPDVEGYDELMKRIGFTEAVAPKKVSALQAHQDLVRQLKAHGFKQNSRETTTGAHKTWLDNKEVKFDKFKEIAGKLGFIQHPSAELSDTFKTEFIKGDHHLTYQGRDGDPYADHSHGAVFLSTAKSDNYRAGLDEEVIAENTYRVYLKSAPGMWAQYDGHVDVNGSGDADDQELFQKAVGKLARTSFPDRPSLSSWRLEKIERL